MGTVLTVRYADIPAGRALGCDMFADLGASATFARDDMTLVVTLDVALSAEDEATACARLTTRDDAEAAAARAINAATPLSWTPDTATTDTRLTALEQQVTRLTDLANALATLARPS